MDSSADHAGSESVANHDAAASVASSEDTKAVSASETTEAAAPASSAIVEPVKSEAHETQPEPAKKTIDAVATKPAPGAALIKLVPAAERFEGQPGAAAQAAGSDRMKSVFMRYGSRAALIVFLLGGAYLASAHFLAGEAPSKPEHVVQAPTVSQPRQPQAPNATQTPAPTTTAALPAAETPERAEMRRVTQQLSDEIRSLKASLDSLRASVAQSQTEEVRGLKKSLDSLKSGLDASKSETNASIAQLVARIEHLQRDQAAKLQQVLERAERAEQKASSVPQTTASIPPAPQVVATLPTKPQSQAPQQSSQPSTQQASLDPQKKIPSPVANWVVRDVYDGIALVEGPNGAAFEVMAGENIPGVGTVKSIERRGTGWAVVTSRGLVETARE